METKEKKQATPEAKTTENLRGLFEDGLRDIYWAEKVLTKTLPKMAKSASTPELANALKNHLNETEEQVSRLEKIFKTIGIEPTAKKNNSIEGLLKESNAIMDETKSGAVRDAGIIAAGQKVKHYEIASYGTLHAFAKTLGEDKAANLLALTLDEEKKTDAQLTGIALNSINKPAANIK